MVKDQIIDFELTLIELNRNIAYKNTDNVINCYNKLKDLYNDILKTDVPLEQKNFVYRTLLKAHNNLTPKNQRISINMPTSITAVVSAIAVISGLFFLTKPAFTGLVVASQTYPSLKIISPIVFLTVIIGGVALFIIKKRNST